MLSVISSPNVLTCWIVKETLRKRCARPGALKRLTVYETKHFGDVNITSYFKNQFEPAIDLALYYRLLQ